MQFTGVDAMQDYERLGGSPTSEARNWAMVCHLAAYAGCIVPTLNLAAPLIIWLLKREEDPFIDDQGREAVNFQITIFLMAIAAGILCLVIIGLLLVPVVFLFAVIMPIFAAVKAKDGVRYRYPLTLRLLK